MYKPLLLTALALLMTSGCQTADRSAAPVDEPLRGLHWLSGSWHSTTNDAPSMTISEEHWTHPAGGTMFGSNRTIANNRTVFFEHLRIEMTDDGIMYIAQPRGRSPGAAFELLELSDQRAVFENLEHDFPQRIIYEREGDLLLGRIEGEQNGAQRVETWTWRRMND